MNLQKYLFIIIGWLSFLPYHLYGQNTSWFKLETKAKAHIQNRTLQFPWAGGINAMQYLTMDLNGDTYPDLVTFDRTTGKYSTFLSNFATRTYTYAPHYELKFPLTTNWAILADYDADGEKELFTYATEGVAVYKKVTTSLTDWQWQLIKPYLTTKGLSGREINLQVVAADIPAIVDFDNDGDLDIIGFELQGDYVELNQNMSMERYGTPDSLLFERNGACWGNFMKHECNDFILGVECGVTQNPPSNGRVEHAGNALLIHDFNADGRKDLLLGHVSCNNMSMLWNTEKGIAANFTSYTSQYPTTSPIDMPLFPAAYLEDVTFDGVKDLLVSSNAYNNDGNVMDFGKSSWLYTNTGTEQAPAWTLTQNDFLQNDMIDVGESASPTLFDYNRDGLMDLFIGNAGTLKEGKLIAQVAYYQNRGTLVTPDFHLVNSDFLALSTLGLSHVKLHFADFNEDGNIDIGLTGRKERQLIGFYISNLSQYTTSTHLINPDFQALNLPNDLLPTDQLFFVDQNKDGKMDFLAGRSSGQISLYLQKGNSYELAASELTQFGPNYNRRYASIALADFDADGQDDLLTVDITGKLTLYYDGKLGNWNKNTQSLVQLPLVTDNQSPYFGNYLSLGIGDYNGDRKPDVAIGTYAGGIYLLENISPSTITHLEPQVKLNVYPNPTTDMFNIIGSDHGTVTIYSLQGTLIVPTLFLQANLPQTISTKQWPSGIYILRYTTKGHSQSQTIVVH